MRIPHLIIGGAPKCGTSSVFEWLAAHPDVVGSSPKEPHFLMDREHPLFNPALNVQDHGLGAYNTIFPDEEVRVRVEASTHYLYQKSAPRMLGQLSEPPRIVFLLRRPADRVYSSYLFSRNNRAALRLDVDFSKYVRAGESESAVEFANPGSEPDFFIWRRDVAYSRYMDWLDEWLRYLPKSSIRICLFEEMRRDARSFMYEFAQWLDLDPSFYDTYDFTARNRSYSMSSPLIHRCALSLSRRLPRWRGRDLLRRLYLGAQRPKTVEQTLEEKEHLMILSRHYEESNQRLAETFDIDLSAWR